MHYVYSRGMDELIDILIRIDMATDRGSFADDLTDALNAEEQHDADSRPR